jgi:hypothetical protein
MNNNNKLIKQLSCCLLLTGAFASSALAAGKEVYGRWDASAGQNSDAAGNRTFMLDVPIAGEVTVDLDMLETTAVNGALYNIAYGKPAAQSSTTNSAGASRAVDGNTNGEWSGNSVTHTNNNANAWWQVDLGASTNISTITLNNRINCCEDRLSDFYIFVSEQPFGNRSFTDLLTDTNVAHIYQQDLNGSAKEYALPSTGRYVRVQLNKTGYLSLAEVQVFGDVVNISRNKTAAQSSTYGGFAHASRAVDGNTNGDWNASSIANTNFQHTPWGQVDLGYVADIRQVQLNGRTNCCSDRLSGFYILSSEQPFGSRSLADLLADNSVNRIYHAGNIATSQLFNFAASGRYVRIQRATTNGMLHIAEVAVLGAQLSEYVYLKNSSGEVVAQSGVDLATGKATITQHLEEGSYEVVAATNVAGSTSHFILTTDTASLRFARNITMKSLNASQMHFRYNDGGTGGDHDLSIWRPNAIAGYHSLGDTAVAGYTVPGGYLIKDDGDLLAPPTDYVFKWNDGGSGGNHDVSLWHPVAPEGYKCLGTITGNGYSKPSTNQMRCIKSEYVLHGKGTWVWNDGGTGSDRDGTIWRIDSSDYRGQSIGAFIATPNYVLGGEYWAINMSALNGVQIGEVTEWHAKEYAPRVYLSALEKYFPAAVEPFLANTHEETHEGRVHLVTNQALGCDSCTDPAVLDGNNPSDGSVPVYTFIVPKPSAGENVTDIAYFFWSPYNNGKRICIGAYIDGLGCIGGYSTFGNHVGDWEHITVRFVNGLPNKVYMSQHGWGEEFVWGHSEVQMLGNHPVVYSALGSHATYPAAGRYNYRDLPNGDALIDYADAGVTWDTWNNLVIIPWQPVGSFTGDLEWLNFSGSWGNPKAGCGLVQDVSGECVLNGGPGGPMFKNATRPNAAQLD